MNRTCPKGSLALVAAVTVLALAGPVIAGHSIASRIDKLWADNERPDSGEACRMYLVQTMPPIFRGSASGHGCVVRAVAAERDGERNLAIHWLMAGYCRNEDARHQIDESGEAAPLEKAAQLAAGQSSLACLLMSAKPENLAKAAAALLGKRPLLYQPYGKPPTVGAEA